MPRVAFTVKTGAGTVAEYQFKARHYTQAEGFARIFDENLMGGAGVERICIVLGTTELDADFDSPPLPSAQFYRTLAELVAN